MFGCLKSVFRVSVPSVIRAGLVPPILLHSALQESVPSSAEGTPNILPFDVAKIQQIPDTCKYFPNFFHQIHHFFSTEIIPFFAHFTGSFSSLSKHTLDYFQALSVSVPSEGHGDTYRRISLYVYTCGAVRLYVWSDATGRAK